MIDATTFSPNGLDLDAFLPEDAPDLCTATPHSTMDRAARLLLAEEAGEPWWVTNGAEPGCLFGRAPRRRWAA